MEEPIIDPEQQVRRAVDANAEAKSAEQREEAVERASAKAGGTSPEQVKAQKIIDEQVPEAAKNAEVTRIEAEEKSERLSLDANGTRDPNNTKSYYISKWVDENILGFDETYENWKNKSENIKKSWPRKFFNWANFNPIKAILALTIIDGIIAGTLCIGKDCNNPDKNKTWGDHAAEASGCYRISTGDGTYEFKKLDCGAYKAPIPSTEPGGPTGPPSAINKYCCYSSSASGAKNTYTNVTTVAPTDPNYPSAGPCLPTLPPNSSATVAPYTNLAPFLSICKQDGQHAEKCPFADTLCTPHDLGGGCQVTDGGATDPKTGTPKYLYVSICASGTDYFLATLDLLINHNKILPSTKTPKVIYIFTAIAAIGLFIAIIYEIIFVIKYRKK